MLKSNKKSENALKQTKMKTKQYKIQGTEQKKSKKEVHSNIDHPQETKKKTLKNLMYYLK